MQRFGIGHHGHFQLVIKKVFGVVEHIAGIEKEAGVLFPGLKALMQIDTGRDHVANLRKIRINRAVASSKKLTHILSGINNLQWRMRIAQ